MQYILTEEEYQELNSNKEFARYKQTLLRNCVEIATSVPVLDFDPPEPRGCVLTNTSSSCNNCIVKDICPNEWKTFY